MRQPDVKMADPTEQIEKRVATAQRLLMLNSAKQHVADFMHVMMPDEESPDNIKLTSYQRAPHALLLCTLVEEMERGERNRTAVSIAPQHGKSIHLSTMGPAWILGRNPKARIIIASYNEIRAGELGDAFRSVIESTIYKTIFPGVELATGSKSKTSMKTTVGGRIFFVGLGGTITGRTADYFIVDDPMKDDTELQNPNFRDNMWKWFFSVAFSRGSNTTRMLCIHCLVGDTLVTMADGSPKRIDQIKVGDHVLSWQGGKHVPAKVLNWAPQGEDDILELKTRNHTIRGNARHPFLVVHEGQKVWKKLGDLAKGDLLVTSALHERSGNRLDEEQAWLLGFMFGDGWLTKRDTTQVNSRNGNVAPRRGIVTCCATSIYPELNARVVAAFEKQFGTTPKLTKFGYIRTEKQVVGKWFDAHGLSGKAKTKQIPNWLFDEKASVRAAFLDGFSRADGSIDKNGRTKVAASNRNLIHGLREIARSVGIRPSNVFRSEQITRPPNSKEDILSEIWSFAWGATRHDAEFETVPVFSVEPAGRRVVYDIQVEGTESFIADGLVVHNTRWHVDDLIGRLCDPSHPERAKSLKHISGWTYLNIPGVIFDKSVADLMGLTLTVPTDPRVLQAFGSKPSVALWAADKNLAHFAQWKLGEPRTFSALVMGHPTIEDGEFFGAAGLLEYDVRELPANLKIYGSSDHAVSEAQYRDSNCIGCVGVDEDDNIWVLPDIRWEQMETDKVVEELLFQFKTHKPLLWGMESELISKSFGPFLHKRMIEDKIYTPILPISTAKDKRTKARAIQGRIQMGKVRFPAGASWWPDAKSQMLQFPYAPHDDFVDFLSNIGQMLMLERGAITVPANSNEPSKKSLAGILQTTFKHAGKPAREKASASGW